MKANFPKKRRPLIRRILRGAGIFFLVLVVVVAAILAYVTRGALYNRFVRFPDEAAAWELIRANRVPVTLDDGWGAYRGNCHSHSSISHDSNVPFDVILAALKEAERDFIFMSDHAVDNVADYSWQWRGLHDGILFVPGFEMDYGFMPWGLPEDTVLRRDTEEAVLAREIREKGGLLFFAHSEAERSWELPELNGMEIYNLHTDTKDEGEEFLSALVPDIIVNIRKYPDHVIRLLYDPQVEILAKWDALNKTRKIVGIQGTDAHQNMGFTGVYTDAGMLEIADTSPEVVAEFELNFVTRLLVRLFFGKVAVGDEIFHFQLDPYARMVRYSATHILANELTEEALCESLEQGRVYVAFDMIADARGFVFFAEDRDVKAVMGEEMPFSPTVRLRAGSPHLGRFKVVQDGAVVHQFEGTELDWQPDGPGNYRVEVELYVVDAWVPWIYSNPLRIEN